jgi:hypothetical protein
MRRPQLDDGYVVFGRAYAFGHLLSSASGVERRFEVWDWSFIARASKAASYGTRIVVSDTPARAGLR